MSLTPPERSLWEATAEPFVGSPALAGAVEAEFCVVGAGYSGLSAALHLAEMGREVVLLEAAEPGAGASGRNGGQVIPGLRHLLADLVPVYGEGLARRLHAFGGGAADATFALIRRHAVACDAVQTGWINAAETEKDMANARERVRTWQALGVGAELLDAPAFAALTGTHAYRGGWIDPRGGSVQPLSYARGLARAATAAGVRLFCRSPALRMTRVAAGHRVLTPNGHVTARRVLLATNAGGFHGPVRRSQLAVRSFQIATRPLSAAERRRILPERQPVSDNRRVLRYFRVDHDGRIVVGGKGTILPPRGPRSFALQRRMLETLYPEIARDGFEHYWGGTVGVTPDRFPRLFVVDDGVFAVLQDNGKGVAWCTACGAVLAEALAGAALDTLPLPVARAPQPIPFHALQAAYAAAGSAWLRFRDRLDHLAPDRKARP